MLTDHRFQHAEISEHWSAYWLWYAEVDVTAVVSILIEIAEPWSAYWLKSHNIGLIVPVNFFLTLLEVTVQNGFCLVSAPLIRHLWRIDHLFMTRLVCVAHQSHNRPRQSRRMLVATVKCIIVKYINYVNSSTIRQIFLTLSFIE